MTYDELLQDFADRDVTAAKEIRRRNSPYWKLRRQWRWLAVATLVITFVPIGVALDDRTNLDVGTLLLYFTVVGALSAAYFAMQQAREARRHTESVLRPTWSWRETTKLGRLRLMTLDYM
jgi:hypothetical protein